MPADIAELLAASEGKTLEFKRDLSSFKQIVKTVVAFANTAGGTLIIGREDDGKVVGVEDPGGSRNTRTSSMPTPRCSTASTTRSGNRTEKLGHLPNPKKICHLILPYNIPVSSIAILADGIPSWNPAPFDYGMWGSVMGLNFIKAKLLDYKENWTYLESHENPFAIVVMAHLKAIETRKDHSLRKQWKVELTKILYEKGYTKDQVLDLYSFIDWVLTLPEALEKIFIEDLRSYEKEKDMPYVTSAERIGGKEGKLELYIDLIHNMKNNNLSEQEIAKLTNLDIEIVRKVLNNEKFEIPLHLLEHGLYTSHPNISLVALYVWTVVSEYMLELVERKNGDMPILSVFFGIIIRMWHDDHPPPHIHASYQGFEALVDIRSGMVVEGKLPKKAARIVKEWCLSHEYELLANWERAQQFEPLERIPGADYDD